MKTHKALALISGGLDSLLAAKVIQDQGIHVEGINFYTGFCVEGHTHAIRKKDKNKQKRNNALWVAETLGMPLHIMDVVDEYKQVVYQPKYGYGKNLNPCLDCKVFMVNKALQWIDENQFDFIITGEVIGQRPKSQRRETMNIVKKAAAANNRLLRPLSAKLLAPTVPEEKGWVDREKLFDFHGRGRQNQMALAEKLGFKDYAQPAGGCCFLTDKYYSAKLYDMWQSNGHKQYDLDDIMLLKVGRHLRPKPHFKVIIGREEGENNYLKGYRKQYTCVQPINGAGPLMLIDGKINDNTDYELAARVLARFCKLDDPPLLKVSIKPVDEPAFTLDVVPFEVSDIQPDWYVDKQAVPSRLQIPTEVITHE